MKTAAWTEARGRLIVAARSAGLCEICRQPAADWSHRVDRSDGGTWSPANGLHLCRRDHQWTHSEPTLAHEGGWRLRSGTDPATAPVWLWTPFGQGWYRIEDSGLYEMTIPIPILPPWVQEIM